MEQFTRLKEKLTHTKVKITNPKDIFYLTNIKREGILIISKTTIQFFTKNTKIFDKIWTGELFIPKNIEIKKIDTNQPPQSIKIINQDIITKQKMRKTKSEIAQIRKSIKLTKKLFKLIDPELTPRENKANIDYELAKAGATHAFEPIITRQGKILHSNYYANHNKGGALLVDMGAKFVYTSDMTRTYPRTKQETQIVNAVRRVKNKTIKFVKEQIKTHNPITLKTIHEYASKLILLELCKLKILNGDIQQMHTKEIHKNFFPHGIGHHLGLDVHDPQLPIPLEKNMVITIEPGIYFHAELITDKKLQKYLNKEILKKYMSVSGVRDEDTIIL
jgi:Xaa-Pro aminopeptidase